MKLFRKYSFCAVCMLAVLFLLEPASASDTVRGVVFHDINQNGRLDPGEPGIPGVLVSNGRDLAVTDSRGQYEIGAEDNSKIFVIKPRRWDTTVDENNLPRFYHIISSGGASGDDFPGLAPSGTSPRSIDFPLYPNNESNRFRVVVFGDTQPRDIQEVHYIMHDSVQELVGVRAAFGVTLGDLVFDDLNLFEPLNEVIGQIGIPWRYVLGNHDIDFSADNNWDARGAYYRTYGPSWYAFMWGRAHFIVLDNIRWLVEEDRRYYRTGLGEAQKTFLENYLSQVPEGELVVYLAHIPWVGSTAWVSEQERREVFDLLASHGNSVSLVAHTHRHYHHFIGQDEGWPADDPHHMVSMGTVCGAWWTGAPDEYGIPHTMMRDGTPAGYGFLEVDGQDWKMTYKAARRPSDFQMHVYGPDVVSRSSLAAGISVFANIFNALPDAEVVMHIGENLPSVPMDNTEEPDPVYLRMQEQEQSLQDVPWRRTGNANANPRHLWKADLPADLEPGTYTIHIQARDAWHTHEGRRIIRIEQ